MSNDDPHFPTDFAAARRLMVASQLRPQGVTDSRVLGAMGAVSRETFVGPGQQAVAYGDRPLRLADGSWMMPPAELGLLLNRLAPKAGERAVVIGKGGAFAAAVLRQIGLEVDAADSADAARGNGIYDLILVDDAVVQLPASLADRLASGGRVGATIVENGVTRLATGRAAIDSAGRKTIGLTSFAEAQLPIPPGVADAPAFIF